MVTLTREELFTLIARFWALADEAEGADGPDRALRTIEVEARAALDTADVPYTYPEWYESPEDYRARKQAERASHFTTAPAFAAQLAKEAPPCS